MKEVLPTAQDMKHIYFKLQRKKNLLPEHAVLRATLNDEVLRLRREIGKQEDLATTAALKAQLLQVLDEKRTEDNAFFALEAQRVCAYMLDQPDTVRLARRRYQGEEINPFNRKYSTVSLADRYASLILNRAFNVRATGRDQIIRTLLNALRITSGSAAADRSIIKLDVRNFFGSIDHEILQRKLDSHTGVPRFVNKHVRSILQAYERIHCKKAGIPKGVPSSSMLAEIYMEEFDSYVRQHPQVVLYLRYVDDVVIVVHGRDPSGLAQALDSQLAKIKLSKNESKSRLVTSAKDGEYVFDYLGYSFGFDRTSGQLNLVDISDAKRDRYIAAVGRLKDYGDSLACWHDSSGVDLYLAAFEYLFFPHATVGDEDSMRIVTGLAYSARFVQHAGLECPRMKQLLAAPSKALRPKLGRLLGRSPATATCPCCSRPIHQAVELAKIGKKSVELRSTLGRHATDHKDDLTRERIGKILWN